MTLHQHYKDLTQKNGARQVVSIGNYDGVHLGHRAVLDYARKVADAAGMELSVLTFEPHPVDFLRPEKPSLRLVSPSRKYELLKECGVDTILAQRFDSEFAGLSAEKFATDVLVGALRAGTVIVGENFFFGSDRDGNLETLKNIGDILGFDVHGEKLVQSDDQGISSSRIRACLLEGDSKGAATLLGRPHEITGVVIRGEGEGRKLGFPTVNLGEVEVLVPQAGIYAATCDIEGKSFKAAVYIGNRPTLGHGTTLEAHLLDFMGELYGRCVTLSFHDCLRGEKRFKSVEELVRQMSSDVAKVRRILESVDDR